VANMLTNGGFEAGAGTDASNWTEVTANNASAGRSSVEKYYGSYSMGISGTDVSADTTVLTSDSTGAVASTLHTVKFWYKGSVTGDVSLKIGDGNAAVAITGPTSVTAWTEVSTAVTSGASGDTLQVITEGNGTEDYDVYIDAITVAAGGTAIDFLTDQMSELIFTIGSDDNDHIVFRSEGSTTQDLMQINQDNVRIFGDLTVDGTTTTVDSNEVNIGDEKLTLLSGVAGAPSSDAFFAVNRGTSDEVALKWNETTDEWELTNDGTNYETIVTSGGSGSLSMDSAYDGGSGVAVDDTNVVFTMGTGKTFVLADATNASKFVVAEGTGTDSVKVDTTGGVAISTDEGFAVSDDSGSGIAITPLGAINIGAAAGQNVGISSESTIITSGTQVALTAPTIDINGNLTVDGATAAFVETGAFTVTSADDSGISVTGADLTFDTSTTGGITIDAIDFLTLGGAGILATSTGANFTITTSSSGDIVLASAGELQFGDSRLTNVEFTDTSNTSFSDGTSTSIVGAINAAYDAASGADTLDEIYSTEDGSGTRTIAQDDGSVQWNITDSYSQIFADAGGSSIMSINASVGGDNVLISGLLDVNNSIDLDGTTAAFNLSGTGTDSFVLDTVGGVDIDTDEGFNLADDSGASIVIPASGAVTVTAATGQTATVTSDTLVALTSTVEVGITAGLIDIDGHLDVDGSAAEIDTTGAISFDAAAASNFTVDSAALTLSTTTGGNVVINSAATVDIDAVAFDVDATAAFTINGSAASTIETTAADLTIRTTGASGEIYFDDFRTAAIPFSDASNTTLPAGATSIIGAINAAYSQSIEISYEEHAVASADVSNDYLVLTGLVPTTGTFPMTPSTLRGLSEATYVSIYLNGLRLSDSEWNYSYTSSEKRLTFDGASDITLVSGDVVAVDVKVIS